MPSACGRNSDCLRTINPKVIHGIHLYGDRHLTGIDANRRWNRDFTGIIATEGHGQWGRRIGVACDGHRGGARPICLGDTGRCHIDGQCGDIIIRDIDGVSATGMAKGCCRDSDRLRTINDSIIHGIQADCHGGLAGLDRSRCRDRGFGGIIAE